MHLKDIIPSRRYEKVIWWHMKEGLNKGLTTPDEAYDWLRGETVRRIEAHPERSAYATRRAYITNNEKAIKTVFADMLAGWKMNNSQSV